jgi:CRISPR-associated protein Cas2
VPMTVIVTRDVPDRFRGFLASAALEIAPGVYTAPDMTAGVRNRVWSVLSDWFQAAPQGSVVMTWPDGSAAGGQFVLALGHPPRELYEHEGIVLARRPLDGVAPVPCSLKTE